MIFELPSTILLPGSMIFHSSVQMIADQSQRQRAALLTGVKDVKLG